MANENKESFLVEEGNLLNNSAEVSSLPQIPNDTNWRKIKGWFNSNYWFEVILLSASIIRIV